MAERIPLVNMILAITGGAKEETLVSIKQPSRSRFWAALVGAAMLGLSAISWCDTPDQFAITVVPDTVGRYEKLEIICDGIDSSDYTNPFDPGEVSVEGHFTDPDSVEEVVYGFWYQHYTRSQPGTSEVLTAVGSTHWRVRYSPKKVGNYTCHVTVTDSGGTVQSETKSFVVTESDSPGFVRVSDQDERYFEFDNGELFFGIMLDLCWWDYRERTYSYDYYFSEMEAHGANSARLWMYNSVDGTTEQSWVCHIQDSTLGANYDLADSWRMDCIVESAREKGVHLMLCFDDVNEFVPVYKWDHNLYNSAWPGGIVSYPFGFFTNAQAKAYYKRLLRYIVSRWGYSTSILSWELWNELHELQHSISDYDQDTVDAWHAEMAQYISSVDPNGHMVTSSNGSFTPSSSRPPGIDFSMPAMSYAQMHGYGFDDGSGWQDLSELVRSYSKNVTVYGKPAIWGECGIVNSSWLTSQWIDPDSGAPRHDSTGIFIHNACWSGLMNGLASTPPFWDWRFYHDYPDWWDQHKAIANFAEDMPLLTADYEVVNNRPDNCVIENAGFEPGDPAWSLGSRFSIVSSPVHSGEGSLYWNSPVAEQMFASYRFGMVPATEYVLSGWVWTNVASGSLILRVEYYGLGSGWQYYEIDLPSSTGGWQYVSTNFTTPVNECQDGYLRITASWATGTAWFDDISVVKTVPSMKPEVTNSNLKIFALRNGTSGLFWIHNIEHSWYNVVVLGQTPQAVSGATMTVSGLDIGGYTVEWWDTYAGTVLNSVSLSTDGAGTLNVALPDIQTDVACKIRRLAGGGGDIIPPTDPEISTAAQVVNADVFAVELSTPSTDENFSNYQVLGGQYSTWTNTSETGPFVFTLVQNVSNTLSVRGRDTFGNVSNAATVVITEDSVLPTTPVIATPDQVIDANSISLTLASPSTDQHFSNYQLRGGQYLSWTDVAETDNFQFTLTEGAAHTLRVRGKDQADNFSAAASIIVTEDSTAPTPPVIATQPQTVGADNITVTLASPGIDTNLAGYQLRGGLYADWTNTALTDNFVFNLIQNAENLLEVRAVDGAGHVSAADSVTITEDSQAPKPPGQPLHTG